MYKNEKNKILFRDGCQHKETLLLSINYCKLENSCYEKKHVHLKIKNLNNHIVQGNNFIEEIKKKKNH